jgi:NADPH:quinone reductase-like Zn-dependent oxidoreductase
MKTMNGIILSGKRPQILDNIKIPPVAEGEVLVKILHSTVNGHEIEMANSSFMRFLNKIMGARGSVLTGLEFSGVVKSNGKEFNIDDQVLGYVDFVKGWKSHAEYISIPEQYIASRPDSLPSAQASTLSMSGLTALVALRETAKIKTGDSVLITGASGGVGVLAIQIAKTVGANVTAMASGKHQDRLIELGTDIFLDYKQTKIEDLKGEYDLVFDLTTHYHYKNIRHLLKDDGIFIPANPFNSLIDIMFHRRNVRWLYVDKGDSKQIKELVNWVVEGRLKTVIDSEFSISDVDSAFKRASTHGKIGRVVIEISSS